MENQIIIRNMDRENLNCCIDLFIDTFTKEPWYDQFESREQVEVFFENSMKNNYFIGYVLVVNDKIIAASLGFKKAWIKGMEYYIDQYFVDIKYQGKGYGSQFIKLIEQDITKRGMVGILLNTERDYPAEKFYKKNGFKDLRELVFFAK